MVKLIFPWPLVLKLFNALILAVVPVPLSEPPNNPVGVTAHVAVAPEGRFCNEKLELVAQSKLAPEIVGGLVGLNKFIVMAALDKGAVCVPHKLALTVTLPPFVPFGVNVMEFEVLEPPQPLGFVQV